MASILTSTPVSCSLLANQASRFDLAPISARPVSRSSRQVALRVRAEGESSNSPAPLPGTGRKFTGYVEKDTAGQENIYAVEPNVYVSESAISTNSAGDSSEGSGGTLLISGFLAVAAIAGATAVVVSSDRLRAPAEQAYTGPPLSFYVQKFKGSNVDVKEVLEELSVSAPSVVAEEALSAVAEEAPSVVAAEE
eukprot:TRINITY_DN36979_c0_g1_i1.p1 TRINITY_DN36979_c0_g1~~TRINITY_DN36979_c0_g1_i1.p1  ORF type:complete len:219 (+),score=35.85 TRINITY_DN36979_c0_g1_i1:76-657(+)